MNSSLPKPRAHLVHFLFLAAAASVALAWGYLRIEDWTRTGTVPRAASSADTWPGVLYGLLALPLLFSSRRGSAGPGSSRGFERFGSLVLALCVWVLAVDYIVGLPSVASSKSLGGGPLLGPLMAAFSLGLGWYAVGGPLPPLGFSRTKAFAFKHSLGLRSLVLFALATTANGKLFIQDSYTGYALLLMLGLVTAVLLSLEQGHHKSGEGTAGQLFARLRSSLGTPSLIVLFGLPAWWLLAAWNGSNEQSALSLAYRLIVPAAVAYLAMGVLDAKGIRTVFGALVLGFGAALAAGFVGVLEALPYCTLEEVLQTRLRILGLHPNLGAALVGIGLCVTVGWTLMGKASGASQAKRGLVGTRRRAIGSLLLAVGGVALYLTGSRAGGLGALIGLGSLFVLLKSRLLPRLTGRVLISLTGLGVALFLLFLTPLGDGIRASLDAQAQTQSALGQRWHIWKMAAAATMDHPVTGIGGLGFPAHAQYAQPSYYDGTTQTFHTHNILLAAASGAGLPGLLLFLAWLVSFFHLGLRACRRATAERPLYISLVAACFGLLVSNLFDLGQSQLTFLPLFFWIAVAVFGAKLLEAQSAVADSKQRSSPSDETESPAQLTPPKGTVSAPILPLVAMVLLWLASGTSLAGSGLLMDAVRYANAGDLRASTARIELALIRRFSLERSKARGLLDQQYKRLDLTEKRLENLAQWTQETPEYSGAWRAYGQALLETGRVAEAQQALAESSRLDPLGASMGRISMLRAWAALELGALEEASQQILAGFRNGANPPQGMGKRRGKTGVVFTGGGLELSLGELLADLGRQLVELAKTDQVRARRDLTGLIEGYRYNGNLSAVSKWIEAVIDASPAPIRATYFQWIEVMLEVGDEDAARSIWDDMETSGKTYGHNVFANLVDKTGGDQDRVGSSASDLDIFFLAGLLVDARLDLAIRLGQEGKMEESERELRRALYDCRVDVARSRVCFHYLLAVPGTAEQRQADLVRLLWNSNLNRKAAANAARYRRVIESLAGDYEGDLAMLEQACRSTISRHGDLGHAGEIFLDVLQREATKSRP